MADLDKGFYVFDKACDECLFSDNKIVSDKRKEQVLRECASNDTHFVCHKSTQVNEEVCCRGFFERYSTNLERVMGRIGCLFIVDLARFLLGDKAARKPEPGELKGVFDSRGRLR